MKPCWWWRWECPRGKKIAYTISCVSLTMIRDNLGCGIWNQHSSFDRLTPTSTQTPLPIWPTIMIHEKRGNPGSLLGLLHKDTKSFMLIHLLRFAFRWWEIVTWLGDNRSLNEPSNDNHREVDRFFDIVYGVFIIGLVNLWRMYATRWELCGCELQLVTDLCAKDLETNRVKLTFKCFQLKEIDTLKLRYVV